MYYTGLSIFNLQRFRLTVKPVDCFLFSIPEIFRIYLKYHKYRKHRVPIPYYQKNWQKE